MTMTISGSGTITGLSAGGLPSASITQTNMATGVGNTGPAFSANAGSGTTVTSGVNTKCAFSNEVFDTNNNYNNAGSTVGGVPAYAFLPTVPGYYQVSVNVNGAGSTATGRVTAIISKNGTNVFLGSTAPQGNANNGYASVSGLIYMNGSTDYIEAYGNIEGTGTLTMNGINVNGFTAALVRGA